MPGPTTHSRSSKFWFRMAVPERLRAKVGKLEIKFSLGTADPAEAKLRQAREQARWRAHFIELEREVETEAAQQAPEIVNCFLAAMAERNGSLHNVIYALRSFIASRLLLAWGPEEFQALNAYRALRMSEDQAPWADYAAGAEPDQDADIIPPEAREELVARIELLHRDENLLGIGFAEAIEWLLTTRRWEVVWPEIALIEEHLGLSIPKGGLLYATVAESLLQRLVEQQVAREDAALLASLPRRFIPNAATEEQRALEPASGRTPGPPPPRFVPVSGKAARPLSAGLAHWIRMRTPRPQSQVEARRAVNRFIELHGDLPIGQITRDQIVEYRDFIGKMSRNLNLERLRAAGGSLRDVVDAALSVEAPENIPVLSPGAIKKDVGALSAILALLKNEGWIAANVASGVAVAGYCFPEQPIVRNGPEIDHVG